MSPIWHLCCSGHPRADTWALISCIFWAGSFVDYSLKMNPVMEPVLVSWQCLRHPERQPEGRTAGPTALPATSPDSHLLAGTMDPDSGALEETGSACSLHSSSQATLAWVHLSITHTHKGSSSSGISVLKEPGTYLPWYRLVPRASPSGKRKGRGC